jgi:hypothetical protein
MIRDDDERGLVVAVVVPAVVVVVVVVLIVVGASIVLSIDNIVASCLLVGLCERRKQEKMEGSPATTTTQKWINSTLGTVVERAGVYCGPSNMASIPGAFLLWGVSESSMNRIFHESICCNSIWPV